MGAYLVFAVFSTLTVFCVISTCRHFGIEIPFFVAVAVSPFILSFLFVLLMLLWISFYGVVVFIEEKIKEWKRK
ncbi:MAG: hypothetical protein AAB767_04875 [Patescibacteria group bacterium]